MTLSVAKQNRSIVAGKAHEKQVAKSSAAMSSGRAINKASDDAAGLAIATKIRGDSAVTKVGTNNARQGSSVLQVADAALEQVGQILDRMKELAAQSNSGHLSDTERGYVNNEYTKLVDQVNAMNSQVVFNGSALIDGSYNKDFQIGIGASDTVTADLSGINLSALTALGGDVSTQGGAAAAIALVDADIETVLGARADVGGLMSRFDSIISNNESAAENLDNSYGTIMDTDMANEMTKMTKADVLKQASEMMTSKANQGAQNVLSLLR